MKSIRAKSTGAIPPPRDVVRIAGLCHAAIAFLPASTVVVVANKVEVGNVAGDLGKYIKYIAIVIKVFFCDN